MDQKNWYRYSKGWLLPQVATGGSYQRYLLKVANSYPQCKRFFQSFNQLDLLMHLTDKKIVNSDFFKETFDLIQFNEL